MTPGQYRRMRRSIGTQEEVAKMLEVDVATISRRERGVTEIDREAQLALRKLADEKGAR